MRSPPASALRTDLALLNRGHDTRWGNLGAWSEAAGSYPAACRALALRVAEAARLGPGDRVLDCGVGAGEQLRVWRELGVEEVVARELLATNLRAARERAPAGVVLQRGSATELGDLEAASFDAVLALDCAYHFAPRERFLSEAARVTVPGGRLALTDFVLGPGSPRRGALRALARWAGIPPANLKPAADYRRELERAGWQIERWDRLEGEVLGGFASWARRHLPGAILARPWGGWPKVAATALGCRWARAGRRLRYVLIGAVRA